MSFKDDVKEDIETVFFDTEEFAETHMVNGKEMRISIDEAELAQRKRSAKSAKASSYEDAVHTKRLAFFVAAKEFGKLPKVNSLLTIDRVQFVVADTANESGTYRITLMGGHR